MMPLSSYQVSLKLNFGNKATSDIKKTNTITYQFICKYKFIHSVSEQTTKVVIEIFNFPNAHAGQRILVKFSFFLMEVRHQKS